MRAALKIPQSPPPTLPDPGRWSPEFHSFLASCLVKDFRKRPSAADLLSHPFITRATSSAILMEMIKKAIVVIESKEDKDLSKVEDGILGKAKIQKQIPKHHLQHPHSHHHHQQQPQPHIPVAHVRSPVPHVPNISNTMVRHGGDPSIYPPPPFHLHPSSHPHGRNHPPSPMSPRMVSHVTRGGHRSPHSPNGALPLPDDDDDDLYESEDERMAHQHQIQFHMGGREDYV